MVEVDYFKCVADGFVPALDQLVSWAEWRPGVDLGLHAKGPKSHRFRMRERGEKSFEAASWLERKVTAEVCYDIAGSDAGALDVWGWCEVAKLHPGLRILRIDLCEWIACPAQWVVENRSCIRNFRKVLPMGIGDEMTVYVGRRGHDGTGVSWCIYNHSGAWRWECRLYGAVAQVLWSITYAPTWDATFYGALELDPRPSWWAAGPRPDGVRVARRDRVGACLRAAAAYIACDPEIEGKLAEYVRAANPRESQRQAVRDFLDPVPF